MDAFYFEIPKLFNRAQVEVLYYTGKMEKEGIPELDKYAIADEDEPMVRILMRDVALKVYSMLAPYTRDIEGGGFFFEAAITNDLGLEIQDCIIYKCNFPEKFDRSVIPALDGAISNAIVNYSISEYLLRNAADGGIFKERYDKNMSEILGFINRRVGLTRTYKLY